MGRKIVRYSLVDAFTDSAFKGNPAAVCLLEEDRDEKWFNSVALEFNTSMTCFLSPIVPEPDSDATSNPRFRLRWFTTVAEVKLCGHATLAAAHTLFTSYLVTSDIIEFVTLSGILTAKKVPEINISDVSISQNGEAQERFSVELNFPSLTTTGYTDLSLISKALNGAFPVDMRKKSTDQDVLVVLSSGKAVVEFQPQFDEIEKSPAGGLIITAIAPPESGFDFYSRYFCPKMGINEDPVCGSAHCALAPYWSKKLGKSDFIAYQASPRGGILNLHVDEKNQRVHLRGKAITVMEGSILV